MARLGLVFLPLVVLMSVWIGDVHDAFRGRRGAFDRSLAGIRALRAAGVRAGSG